jgi:hypothetical protein
LTLSNRGRISKHPHVLIASIDATSETVTGSGRHPTWFLVNLVIWSATSFGDLGSAILSPSPLPVDPNTKYPVCTDGRLACLAANRRLEALSIEEKRPSRRNVLANLLPSNGDFYLITQTTCSCSGIHAVRWSLDRWHRQNAGMCQTFNLLQESRLRHAIHCASRASIATAPASQLLREAQGSQHAFLA